MKCRNVGEGISLEVQGRASALKCRSAGEGISPEVLEYRGGAMG